MEKISTHQKGFHPVYSLVMAALFLLTSSAGFAQTRIKGNAAYWLLGMPNVSVEKAVSDHLTLSGELFYSPWKSVKGNPLQFLQLNPDVRWYPKKAFDGFYAGAYGSVQGYELTKWNYWNMDYFQKGWGYGFGAMIGYQAILTDRWSLDMHVGGGWHYGRYRGFYKSTGKMYVDWNSSGEWLPYRLAISVCYRL